jgi:hypothetical protein
MLVFMIGTVSFLNDVKKSQTLRHSCQLADLGKLLHGNVCPHMADFSKVTLATVG